MSTGKRKFEFYVVGIEKWMWFNFNVGSGDIIKPKEKLINFGNSSFWFNLSGPEINLSLLNSENR